MVNVLSYVRKTEYKPPKMSEKLYIWGKKLDPNPSSATSTSSSLSGASRLSRGTNRTSSASAGVPVS